MCAYEDGNEKVEAEMDSNFAETQEGSLNRASMSGMYLQKRHMGPSLLRVFSLEKELSLCVALIVSSYNLRSKTKH